MARELFGHDVVVFRCLFKEEVLEQCPQSPSLRATDVVRDSDGSLYSAHFEDEMFKISTNMKTASGNVKKVIVATPYDEAL